MALPTITDASQLPQYLKVWQTELAPLLKKALVPRIPWNFAITSKQGGNYATWQGVAEADGYILDISTTGDFSTGAITVPLLGQNNTAYFDNVPTAGGAAPAIRYYRVRATAGTTANPQSVSGRPSQVISSTAIAPNDTVTASTTTRDTTTAQASSTGGRSIYKLPGL